jgi:hypothetical protein
MNDQLNHLYTIFSLSCCEPPGDAAQPLFVQGSNLQTLFSDSALRAIPRRTHRQAANQEEAELSGPYRWNPPCFVPPVYIARAGAHLGRDSFEKRHQSE